MVTLSFEQGAPSHVTSRENVGKTLEKRGLRLAGFKNIYKTGYIDEVCVFPKDFK